MKNHKAPLQHGKTNRKHFRMFTPCGYQDLANAIYIQAVLDINAKDEAIRTPLEWFRSDWAQTCAEGLDPDIVKRLVNKQYGIHKNND